MAIPRNLSKLADGVDTSGTLAVDHGGTGVVTLTGYVKGNGTSAFTASGTVPASDINGTVAIANGGTGANTAESALSNLGGVSTGKAIAMAIVFGS